MNAKLCLKKKNTAIEQYNSYFAATLEGLLALPNDESQVMTKDNAREALWQATIIQAYLDLADITERNAWLIDAPSKDLYINCKRLQLMASDLLLLLEDKAGRDIYFSELR
jgi:hypothetical protein